MVETSHIEVCKISNNKICFLYSIILLRLLLIARLTNIRPKKALYSSRYKHNLNDAIILNLRSKNIVNYSVEKFLETSHYSGRLDIHHQLT